MPPFDRDVRICRIGQKLVDRRLQLVGQRRAVHAHSDVVDNELNAIELDDQGIVSAHSEPGPCFNPALRNSAINGWYRGSFQLNGTLCWYCALQKLTARLETGKVATSLTGGSKTTNVGRS
jgi:hypothetical protein